MSNKVKSIIKFIVVIVILTAFLQYLLPAMTSDEFKGFVVSVGVLGPLIVIGYTVLSHVVAPVAGTPGVVLGYVVYGVVWGSIYLYIASVISGAINFWIARNFGRNWVTKLVGQKSMKEVDSYVEIAGDKILVLARIFGFSVFELISYAAGLTNMSFKRYFAITLIFSAIPSLVFAYMFRNSDFTQPQNLGLWFGILIIVGILFGIYIKRSILNSKKLD